MRVVTSAEMAAIDRRAWEEFGLPTEILMEAAGIRVAGEALAMITAQIPRRQDQAPPRVHILCGTGNNGGDGFVAARHLLAAGCRVRVYVAGSTERINGAAAVHFNALLRQGLEPVLIGDSPRQLTKLQVGLSPADLVIDALCGTGTKGALRGSRALAVEAIVQSKKPVLSVDIPSGIDADTGDVVGVAVQANRTVTFALPKMGLLLLPGREYVGELVVRPIGLPMALLTHASDRLWVTPDVVAPLLPPRPVGAHKGRFGHVLVVAGSMGMCGAAVLSATGALRAGAGLVTCAVPASLASVVAAHLVEAMVLPLPESEPGVLGEGAESVILEAAATRTVVVMGPGLSRKPAVQRLVARLYARLEQPAVVDADALRALADGGEHAFASPGAARILTPHPGEAAYLLGTTASALERDRERAARQLAERYGAVVVLKGVPTLTAVPPTTATDSSSACEPHGREPHTHLFVNHSGNQGLATGGTGDVLAGIVGGLLAQGASPVAASVAGVFLHGFAADLLIGDLRAGHRPAGTLAGDVAQKLPQAMAVLSQSVSSEWQRMGLAEWQKTGMVREA